MTRYNKQMQRPPQRRRANKQQQQQQSRRRNFRRGGVGNVLARNYALGSTAPRTPGMGGGKTFLGTDSVYLNGDLLSGGALTPGQLITRIPISATMGPSITELTRSWQEYRFTSVRVVIPGQGGAITKGQFVQAFTADPLDEVPVGLAAISYARSQQCNQSANYRDVCQMPIAPTVMLGTTQGWYRTNDVGDARLASPGSLDLYNITTPDSSVGMEVQVHWSIEVRSRTLGRTQLTTVVAARSFGVSASNTADTPFTQALVYNSTVNLKPEDFTPALQRSVLYRLPAEISMQGNTGAAGSVQSAIVTHLGSPSGDSVELYRYNPTTASFDAITPTNFTAKPSIIGGPIWEVGSRFTADARSPAFKQGF